MVRLLRLLVVAALGWTLALAASAGAVAAVPEPPTDVVAVAGDAQATVSFLPPANDGGSPITGYTVTSDPPGGVDGDAGSTATTHTITGLANGVAYTFTVIATNADGPGTPSAPSNIVKPGARTRLVVPGSAATTAKTVPGGSVSFDVRLDAWVPTIGVAFRLTQASPAGNGYFSITARDFTGSIYDDTGSGDPDAVVLAPASALLDPDNDDNLGRNTVNFVGAATGTDLFIERLTLTASLATPVGTYVVGPLTPGYSSTITDDLANDYPMGGSFTIVVGQSLTVVRAGSGTGTVTADTGAIDCGATCSDIYAGTQVTLTPVPAADSFFGGWSGEGCGGTGLCVVTVDAARTVTATFTAKIVQAIGAITSVPPTLVYSNGGTFTVSASGGASGNPVTFTSQTPLVCTTGGTHGATVTMLTAGLCTLAANQAGNASYAPAPQATQGFTIAQASQAIGAITSVPPTLVYSNGGTFTVSASGGASGNPVTFTSQTPLVCTTGGTHGATVTMLTAGLCTLAANQAGNASYTPAPQATQGFTIDQASQAIGAITSVPPTLVYSNGGTFTVSASGGASGNPVTFTSQTPLVCTTGGTHGATVTMLTAGLCTLAANQAGNASYTPAPQATQGFTIAQASQAIGAITSVPPTLVYSNGGTFTVSASGGASGNPVTFTSQTPLVCTTGGTHGATVTMLTAGLCTLAANQAGNASYAPAPQATQGFTIDQASQAIGAITSVPPTLVYSNGGTFIVSASGGASGNPVVFTSQTPLVCTTGGTHGATVTMLTAGLCTLAANQAGNASYTPAPQVTQGFTIAQASQAIGAITSAPPTLVYSNGGTFTVSASGGASGNPVVFTSQTPLVCTTGGTHGATVTMLTAGLCTLAANQAGNASYTPAPQATQGFTIAPISQAIGPITSTPPTLVYSNGGTFTVSASGGASGNPVTFTSQTPAVCTTGGANGATVSMLTAGLCTVAANQAGNATHAAAPQVTQGFTIGQASQAIGPITSTPPVLVYSNGGTFTVSASGGASGNPVTFTSQTPLVCATGGTNGATVAMLAAGDCTIAANQAGDANHAAALELTQAFTVLPTPPQLIGAASRKLHGAAGAFDLALGLNPASPTTEPRTGGTTGSHTLVFTFDQPVLAADVAITEGAATLGTPTFGGNEISIPLSDVVNETYLTVAVSNVASAGGTGGSGSARVGFLVADVNGSRNVTLSDLLGVNAVLAQIVTPANFLRDVNVSGTLSVADILLVNANLTRVLPPPLP